MPPTNWRGCWRWTTPTFGGPKPGNHGRRASGKAKVVVAVQTPGNKPRFATMHRVPEVGRNDVKDKDQESLAAEATVRTDGWQLYGVLAELSHHHKPVITSSGKNAVPLIANVKGNIHRIYHGISKKHLPFYLAEFCYLFNLRFWVYQMFNRMVTDFVGTQTITFSPLRQ
jgi:hypothetical protein